MNAQELKEAREYLRAGLQAIMENASFNMEISARLGNGDDWGLYEHILEITENLLAKTSTNF